MRGAWILAGLLFGGCDVVFRIDRIGVSDSMPDALDPSDAPDDSDASQQTSCETDTHDEDGDSVADACDVCPGIADDQTDSDMDGVGDVCDPSSQSKHDIALFLSFAGADIWNTVAGNWPRDGESLVYDAVTLDAYGITVYQGAVPAPPFVVEYHFSVDSIEAQGSGFQVILDSDDMGRGITCGLQRHESPTIKDVVRTTYAMASVSSETDINAVTTGGYRVIATYDRDDLIRCVASADDSSTGGSTMLGLSTPPAAGTLGFRSFRVGAHLHYIAIYKEE